MIFSDFYKAIHPKRLLRWTYSQATCVVKCNCYSKPFDIETSQTAALVLLAFNNLNTFIKPNYPDTFHSVLSTLSHPKHPLLKGKYMSKRVEEIEDTYVVNTAWVPPPLHKSKRNLHF
jgi:hypothetical protein